jgi:hypothetical protein
MSAQKPDPQRGMKRIDIKIASEIETGTYANFFSLLQDQNEFILDFGLMMPTTGSARIGARIIIHPRIAKQLLRVLQQAVQKYEATFGTITPPRQAPPPTLN